MFASANQFSMQAPLRGVFPAVRLYALLRSPGRAFAI